MTEQEWIAEQMLERYPWASNDQLDCIGLLFDLERGFHHFTARVKPFGNGVEYNGLAYGLATYDVDQLTRLVFLAHDRCIRVELGPSAPGRIKIILHRRHHREGGDIWFRHPTLEAAVSAWRARHEREVR